MIVAFHSHTQRHIVAIFSFLTRDTATMLSVEQLLYLLILSFILSTCFVSLIYDETLYDY